MLLYNYSLRLKLYLTREAGCACDDVERPQNFSKGWAAVVQYGSSEDCSINQKVKL